MKVLVDTSVWSLALRRRPDEKGLIASALADLINDLRVVMIGPIRQELLSGISDARRFAHLRDKMRAFDDLPLVANDFELAAEYSNLCRSNGVQGSHTDLLICAVSASHGFEIFTTDKDFERYQEYLPITLYQIR
jgi:predicted nucleic acid-binding protein